MNMKIKVKKLNPEARVPSYAHPGDAGLDLYSCEDCVINAGERRLVHTGISMELPQGFVSLIWDKSGVALNGGIKTMGGVIDCHYRGEYGVVMFNTSKENYVVRKGDKIAQVLVQPVESAEIEEVSQLSETKRGFGAFGSTGIK